MALLGNERVEIKDKMHLAKRILNFSTFANRAIDRLHESVGLPVNTAPKVPDDVLSDLREAIAKLEDIAGPKKSGP
jgi:hypothetical protein